MGTVGECFDNAIAETVFASFECELVDSTTFRSYADARLAVFDYIEGWSNPRRRHPAIGCLSPASFERLHELTQAA
ncbi:MAG: IS3 family transposase [Ardenticatenia bacterium]|nr:IS3 family transposase [Ardenticatenia bacterium]